MFSRWFQQEKIIKLGFEDVLYGIHHNNECILMNTMPHDLQNCLIQNTLLINIEEQTINKLHRSWSCYIHTYVNSQYIITFNS